jgi:hypothetical protein
VRTKEQNVGHSVAILCDCLRTILAQTGSCGVPLGVSVESVSIFREEIDAAHDLFAKLQAIMLDGYGMPWKVLWIFTADEQAVALVHAAASRAAAAVGAEPASATTAASGVLSALGAPIVIKSDAVTQVVHVVMALAIGYLLASRRS